MKFQLSIIIFQVGISNVGILNTRIKLFHGLQIKGLVAIDQTATKVHNADDSYVEFLLFPKMKYQHGSLPKIWAFRNNWARCMVFNVMLISINAEVDADNFETIYTS